MIYVASSWRNHFHTGVCAMLQAAKLEFYNFKDSEGFHWSDIDPEYKGVGDSETTKLESFKALTGHPIAQAGFARDYIALIQSHTVLLVLPAGKSAHLELGYGVGAGKRTAVYAPTEMQPELMYGMVDFVTDSTMDLLAWLGVKD